MEKYIIEMLLHVAVNTHKEPKKVIVLTKNQDTFQTEFNKYKFENIDFETLSPENYLDELAKLENASLDILVVDEVITENHKKFFAHTNRVLKNDGLVSLKGNFEALKYLANEFLIAMPYFVNFPQEKTEVLLFGSKLYHPTADIILQRADFIDSCEYYNSDIQYSSFTMPNSIKSQIKDFVKN